MMRQGDLIDNSSAVILIIDKDDIRGYLKGNNEAHDTKTVNGIFGTVRRGKFTDAIMEDFWLTIDAMKSYYEDSDDKARAYLEKLGAERFKQ